MNPAGSVLALEEVSRRFAPRPPGADRRFWSRRVAAAVLGRSSPLNAAGPATVTALDGVSLTVRRGEAVGVIGRNGAGKTTLLRLAAGHLMPDEGRVTTRGRVVPLMDLTAGFDASLSGHETVAVGAALLGLGRREVTIARPLIEAFSGLDAATLARPVGGYSSGEALRLGFAIAAHARPDLLLVDEVLSVGDFPFRQRCLAHMMVLKDQAGVVLVSHNLAEVARFCDRVVVLERGRVAFDGEPEAGLACYRRMMEAEADAPWPDRAADSDSPPFLEPLFRDDARVAALDLAWLDDADRPTSVRPFGAPLMLRLRATLRAPAAALSVGVPLFAPDGTRLTALASDAAHDACAVPARSTVTVTLKLPEPRLNPGPWYGVAVLHDGPGTLVRQALPPLTITDGPSRHWGHVTPAAHWTLAVQG